MTRAEQLRERYEDAVFALLMEEAAQLDGTEVLAEAERLNAEPSAAVDADADERCRRVIRDRFARQRARRVGKTTLKVLKCAAIAAGLAVLLLVGAMAASETVYHNVFNILLDISPSNLDFHFYPASTTPSSEPLTIDFTLKWLPEGVTLTASDTSSGDSRSETYRGENSVLIRANVTTTDGLGIGFDTEDAVVSTIEINGSPATLIVKTMNGLNDVQIIQLSRNNAIMARVWAAGLPTEDVIKIMENMDLTITTP